MWTGDWTTMSNILRLPVCTSIAASSPRSTRNMTLSVWLTLTLLMRFLFVKCSDSFGSGRRRSLLRCQGPGPIRSLMSSETSEGEADVEGMKSAKGECSSARGSSEMRGRIDVSSFEGDLMESSTARVMGSVCAIERKFDQ